MHQVEVAIWDTAGQERFHSLAPLYYRDADAALLVFLSFSLQWLCTAMRAPLRPTRALRPLQECATCLRWQDE